MDTIKQNFKNFAIQLLNERSALLCLYIAILCVGLYHEFLCGFFSLLLSIRVVFLIFKKRSLTVKFNSATIFVFVAVLLYLLSCFWAVDAGVAVFGFIKFLPVLLFLILCLQENNNTETLLEHLPYFTATITIVSAVLLQFDDLRSVFSVAGRLSGTFQYSNTYAVLCLISLIFLLCDKQPKAKEIVTTLILIFGILYSGSRTVLLLTLLSLLALFIRIPQKKFKLYAFLAVIAATGIFVLWAILSDNTIILERIGNISFTESTFVGRLLYWQDALPQILRHPFGLGYMGYYFSQSTFQTGVYSVTAVHNDFLQILLDIGWVPFIILLVAVLKTFFSKNISFARKFALFIFCCHTFFDFNLQFVSMFMVFVLLLNWNEGEAVEIENIGQKCAAICVCLTAIIGVYFGFVAFFQYIGNHEMSLALYRYNTFSKIEVLKTAEDVQEIDSLADEILSQNDTVSIAYSAKARVAYSQGDFKKVIKFKKEAIRTAPYSAEEYEEYARMLITGILLYRQNKDFYSAQYCEKKLLEIPEYINDALANVSYLGTKINDQAELELSKEVQSYINEVEIVED